MKRMLKTGAVATLTVLALAVTALPAAAFDVVIFTGTAEVCADTVYDPNGVAKPRKAPCPITKKDGSQQDRNNGLYLVGHPGGKNDVLGLRLDPADKRKWQNRYGNFRFRSGGLPPAPPCLKFNPLADTAPVPCRLKVEGKLAPVQVGDKMIGAACGISQGLDGEGWIQAANGSKATVWDVGWPTSAGGTLPVKGHYYFKNQKSKLPGTNKPQRGQFLGVVQAQGGAQCVKTGLTSKGGATNFNVAGIVVMTDQDKNPGKTPPPKKNRPWEPK